jgi:hypothetical protein
MFEMVDNGNRLTFRIRKFRALEGERFVIKASTLLGKNLSEVPKGAKFNAVSFVRAICSVPYEDSKELLDMLLGCVYKVDGKIETVLDDSNVDSIISSPANLMKLRIEAVKENMAFFTEIWRLVIQELENMSQTVTK